MTNNSPTRDIPNTRLTESLRILWSCQDDGESFEDWYARHCDGGTPNGRALAAVLFDRALCYWADFFTPADGPALAVWGDLFDTSLPFVTPDIIEHAVDAVAAAGIEPSGPAVFIKFAEALVRGRS